MQWITLKGEKVNSEFGTTEMPFVNTPFFPSQLEATDGSGDDELYLMTAPRKFKAALPRRRRSEKGPKKGGREGGGHIYYTHCIDKSVSQSVSRLFCVRRETIQAAHPSRPPARPPPLVRSVKQARLVPQ